MCCRQWFSVDIVFKILLVVLVVIAMHWCVTNLMWIGLVLEWCYFCVDESVVVNGVVGQGQQTNKFG